MASKNCPKCGFNKCMCQWCAGSNQCCSPQHSNKYCAGPFAYTGEYAFDRPCCLGLKKCNSVNGSWCSATGNCNNKPKTICPSPPFYNYSDRLVKECYNGSSGSGSKWVGIK